MRQWSVYLSVAVLAAAAGGLVTTCRAEQDAGEAAEAADAANAEAGLVGRPRPDYTLGAIDGSQVSADAFDGDVVLVNFWATWCVPCRAEMPMLAELQSEYRDAGFRIVGIALDDLEQAREFADELGVDYTILVGQADVMAVSRDYGNRAGMLPYSVLIDRAGIVRWARLGELERDQVVERIEPLL